MMFCEMPTPFKERIWHNSLANDVNRTTMLLSQKKAPPECILQGHFISGICFGLQQKDQNRMGLEGVG